MPITRLQGPAFHNMKELLIPISYSESTNGRIRVEYRHSMNARLRFSHWLNPDEQSTFDKTSLPLTVWKKRRSHEDKRRVISRIKKV